MKTGAAYIRVSTGDQLEFSPESQLKAVRKYAHEHCISIPEKFIFTDEGISGRSAEKRPAFQKMITLAKSKPKPFDVILLWKFSRFARSREDSIVYKSMLRKQCGIDVISVSEQIGEDKTAILIEALLEAMDEYYSLNLAGEVRRGMNEKFSRGGVVSQPPFGYKMDQGIFVPDKIRCETVKFIFSSFLAGESIRKIAENLNSLGIKTRNGNKFENRTIEYILTNPVYTGKLRRSKNGRNPHDRFHQDIDNLLLSEGKHVPIIDSETFEAVQKKIFETKRLYTKHVHKNSADYMLKGLVHCGNCGSTMSLASSLGGLQCCNYSKGVCKVSHFVSLNKLNRAVISRLNTDLNGYTFIIEKTDMHYKKTSGELSILWDLFKKEEKKLVRIKEAFESGIYSSDEYIQSKQNIITSISLLKSRINGINSASKQIHTDTIIPKSKYSIDIISNSELSESTKNIILRSFIDRIIFIKSNSSIRIYYKNTSQ